MTITAMDFKMGDQVIWNQKEIKSVDGEFAEHLRSKLPGDGPFTVAEARVHEEHRCPECGSSDLVPGHIDIVDEMMCEWDEVGDTYHRYQTVLINGEWFGSDWFVLS